MKINESLVEKISKTFKVNSPDILAAVGVLGLNTSKEFIEFAERKGTKVYVVEEQGLTEFGIEYTEIVKCFITKEKADKYIEDNPDCQLHVYEMELE